MKIKAIQALCKAKKTVFLSNIGETQWISDGVAAYPLDGMPEFDCKSILRFFDIPEDKWSKFYCKDDMGLGMEFAPLDTALGEKEVEPWRVKLTFGGLPLIPLKTSEGPVFIDARYLKPFEGMDEPPRLFKRVNRLNQPYIAVKSGFLLCGVIFPENFSDSIDVLRSDLEEIARGLALSQD